MTATTCPRCSKSFPCHHEEMASCACADVPLSAEQRAYLARHYQGCLCADCLREVREQVRPVTVRDLSDFLLDFATTLMSAGVHTSRLVRNVTRIAASFGYEAEMVVFQRHITLHILNRRDDGLRRTSVRTLPQGAFNFEIISDLSTLSWDAHDHHLTLYELRERFGRILTRGRINRWGVLGLVSLGNASFCHLFGGDLWAMGLVLAATCCGFLLRQEMTRLRVSHYAVFILSSFVASMVAAAGVWFSLGATPQVALATSVLFLIPGVPLINSIIDLLEGYVLMGISRAVNAVSLIICLSLGLSMTLLILGNRAPL